ncbi:P-loop containing nucleoside triphosphate hydrolase protein [Fomitiporia mediterranea MF3/22]|uniref:P-loop containing nucleoside triphosphate hydrolase protein n=1 Tax=Fomitiporia mediterranea (strain MF3/22) TaxID=694068 RepID=UPI0004408133|nr:P-loop containing nucleoside triphosphate hydrolase protein [Fomitiporia mediterranea MF3/22]EJD01661.1 P-loop containing nucleoside triphosphate hydrolase protein [Fomitiporia mediterranea MF3/22]
MSPEVCIARQVLDEADRLLNPTFAPELEYLFNILPRERQTCLFTATMTESIKTLIAVPPRPGKQKPFIHRMVAKVETVETLEQFYVLVPSHVREPYLFHLLCSPPESIIHMRCAPPEPAVDPDAIEQPPPTIIFCARARTAAYLATLLQTLGIRSTPLHSRLTQRARLTALGLFRARVVPVLVCTDVGARGLDVDDVALLVNWDMPQEPEEYTQLCRTNGTARADRDETAGDGCQKKLNAVSTAKWLANMLEKKNFQAKSQPRVVYPYINHLLAELHDSDFGKREEIHKIKQAKRERVSAPRSSS